MTVIGMILAGIGVIIMLIFGIILLIKAFQESVWWGLGYIFVPFVALIFIIKYWSICKKPFLYSLVGVVIYVIGMVLLVPSMNNKAMSELEGMGGLEEVQLPAQ